MLSFMRMFRGTFHMMLPRLNWSSHAIVMLVVRPSPRPATEQEHREYHLPHRRARDNRDPLLERIVEGLEVRPERLHGLLERGLVVRLDRRTDCGQALGRPVEALDHRVVVLVQPVQRLLLDPDRGAEAGVALLPRPDAGLDAPELEPPVPDARQANRGRRA